MSLKVLKYAAIAALSAGVMAEKSSAATVVGLELALLVDTSGSVDNAEFLAQRQGYVTAFLSPAIHALIAQVPGGIAVNYVQWDASPTESIGWTHLTDAASSIAFANTIGATARSGNSGTGVANAINFATTSITTNDFDGVRLVFDVSGDGADNVSGAGSAGIAGAAALAAGVDRINGLPILGEAGLLAYYQTQVQAGAGSFTLPVASFADFAPAVERKIAAEIGNTRIPEGGPGLAMSAILLAGVAAAHRKLRRRNVA